MFKDDKAEIVALAVKNIIGKLEFPPTIADVRKEINRTCDANKPSAIDEWNAIRKAISTSIYYAQENFDALPEVAKKFVGSPKQLRDWATMQNFNDSVIRGQFLNQYEALAEKEKYRAIYQKLIAPETTKVAIEGGTDEA